MDEAILKNILRSLITIVREQHLQIGSLRGLLLAHRNAFDPATAERADVLVHDADMDRAASPPYRDEMLLQLDEALRLLEKA